MIQYPRICVQVKDFVLQSGHDDIQSFHHRYSGGRGITRQVVARCQAAAAAYTFCRNCGVHVFSALQQNKKELFINLRCLKVGTFVPCDLNSPPSKVLRVFRSFASLTTASTTTATIISEEDEDLDDDSEKGECIVVTKDDVSGITEHVNTVVVSPTSAGVMNGFVSPSRLMATDGISITSGDGGADDLSASIASTTHLEETTYRLRKALSGDAGSSISSGNINTNEDLTTATSSLDWNKLSQTTASPIRNDDCNVYDGIHTVPENDVMVGSFMDVATSTSMHEYSYPPGNTTDLLSLSQDIESQEQLRKFMSKHVATTTKD